MNAENLLPVKSFQETLRGGYCGPANLKMVLGYWGINKSEEEVAIACNRDPELGTDEASLKKAAESYGLKVEIEKLKQENQEKDKLSAGLIAACRLSSIGSPAAAPITATKKFRTDITRQWLVLMIPTSIYKIRKSAACEN